MFGVSINGLRNKKPVFFFCFFLVEGGDLFLDVKKLKRGMGVSVVQRVCLSKNHQLGRD